MFDNPFSMVVAIVLITAVASIMRAKYGMRRDHKGNELPLFDNSVQQQADTKAMQEEIARLKDRISVLERIATDNHGAANLDREIERLRDR